MTENLRLDVSSIKRDIELHNGTVDRLHQRAIADRTEKWSLMINIVFDILNTHYLKGREIANRIERVRPLLSLV